MRHSLVPFAAVTSRDLLRAWAWVTAAQQAALDRRDAAKIAAIQCDSGSPHETHDQAAMPGDPKEPEARLPVLRFHGLPGFTDDPRAIPMQPAGDAPARDCFTR